ncbi:MAG: hypothetical protein WDO74_34815 [Pseudomonadota bacterium]
MSISATSSNYISQDTIDTWMQTKLGDAYSDIRKGMDTSGHRTDAEKALNDIKNKLLQMKTNGKDASEVTAAMNKAIEQFSEEFPDVKKVLQGFADTLNQRAADARQAAESPQSGWETHGEESVYVTHPPTHHPEPVHIDEKEIDSWTTGITDAVDALSKEDQLGLLNLNQLNSHIGQTENIASALMDSRNKVIDGIINRIG